MAPETTPPTGIAGPRRLVAEDDRRASMARMYRIHLVLIQKRAKLPSTKDLATELDVSPTTIGRDIRTMERRLFLPVEYVHDRWGYRYTKENVKFPTLNVTDKELFAMAVLLRLALSYSTTSLIEGSKSVLRKLQHEVGTEARFDAEAIAAVVSFRGTGYDLLGDLTLFRTLVIAALERSELVFDYRKLGAPRPELKKVRPLHIYCYENALYLRADDVESGNRRSYALVRMRDVVETGGRFVRPPEYDPDEEFEHCLGVFLGEPPQDVRIQLRGVSARVVQERQIHPSQRVVELPDGTVELSLRVAVTMDLRLIVRKWGPDARVLLPVALRDQVREDARIAAEERGWEKEEV